MQAEQQPDDSLQALRQAIRDDDDARIVRLWTATEPDRTGALTPQEHVRVDLAMRRVNNRRAIAAIVPYAVGGLFLVVAVIVSVIVIVPRLLEKPTATPGVAMDTPGVATAIAQVTATATHRPTLVGAQGQAISQKRTSTPTPTHTWTVVPTPTGTPTQVATSTPAPTSTPTSTQESTPVPTPTATPTPAPTHTQVPTHTLAPTSTPTSTPAPTHTLTPRPSPTSTQTPLPAQTPTRTPPPTSGLRPAPRLEAPSNGAEFGGWNAEVVLRWSDVGPLAADEYYVVRIPYDNAGGVAEFWRKETSLKVPPHFSGRDVGFADRHYNWTVQVLRCTDNCASATDDNARKGGQATSTGSAEGLFFWHPDIGGGGTVPTPTRV
jgi:hypothetical protein